MLPEVETFLPNKIDDDVVTSQHHSGSKVKDITYPVPVTLTLPGVTEGSSDGVTDGGTHSEGINQHPSKQSSDTIEEIQDSVKSTCTLPSVNQAQQTDTTSDKPEVIKTVVLPEVAKAVQEVEKAINEGIKVGQPCSSFQSRKAGDFKLCGVTLYTMWKIPTKPGGIPSILPTKVRDWTIFKHFYQRYRFVSSYCFLL